MLVFVVGTTAELIKVAPVWQELTVRGAEPRLWYTGQHGAGALETMAAMGMPAPHRWLAGGPTSSDVARPADFPVWAAGVLTRSARLSRALRAELAADGRPGLVLVHGDTFTTVLGSVLGRTLGVEVAHIEAGMRSGSWRSPFPEEVNRRLVSRLAGIHFAPSPREVSNLGHARGEIVETGANTVLDALEMAIEMCPSPLEGVPRRYGLVTLHRFELVRDSGRLREVMETLGAASHRMPLVMLLGSSERARLDDLGLLDRLPSTVTIRPKLPYPRFVATVARAELVITDSGGLQQECHYLGVPCLVHRERTETYAGLGRTTLLTGLRAEAIEEFVADPDRYRSESLLGSYHPSKIIAEALAARRYL